MIRNYKGFLVGLFVLANLYGQVKLSVKTIFTIHAIQSIALKILTFNVIPLLRLFQCYKTTP